jgi:hypothetical protein
VTKIVPAILTSITYTTFLVFFVTNELLLLYD